jgi:hypothetical protein
MVTITGETVIGLPVADVFDFVADERNEPTFNPRMTSVKQLTDGPIDEGTRFAATSRTMGRDVDMVIELTAYDRPRMLASTTTMPSADIRGTLTFDAHPSGTRMRWSWDIRPTGVSRLLGPLIARLGRRQEEAVWAGLKRHLEGAAPPPR